MNNGQLPALINELTSDCLATQERLKAWLVKEQDLGNIAEMAKQLSAAQESLKKCRDGENITLSMQNMYAAAKLRCQRRGGEILKEMVQHQGGRPSEKNSATMAPLREHLSTDTDDQAKNISRRWQKMAEIPEDQFEILIDVDAQTEAETEITAASVLRASRQLDAETEENPDTLSGISEDDLPFAAVHRELTQIGTAITKLIADLQIISNGDYGNILASNFKSVKYDLEQARHSIVKSRPYAQCPHCVDSKLKTGTMCVACDGLRWTTKYGYNQAPIELKAKARHL